MCIENTINTIEINLDFIIIFSILYSICYIRTVTTYQTDQENFSFKLLFQTENIIKPCTNQLLKCNIIFHCLYIVDLPVILTCKTGDFNHSYLYILQVSPLRYKQSVQYYGVNKIIKFSNLAM